MIAKDVIDGHEQAVLDRTDGALFSTPARQTVLLSLEIAVLGVRRGVCHFSQL
jgi:hypothetical protein